MTLYLTGLSNYIPLPVDIGPFHIPQPITTPNALLLRLTRV